MKMACISSTGLSLKEKLVVSLVTRVHVYCHSHLLYAGDYLQLMCNEEELSGGKVNITCEIDNVLESVTCSVDNRPPQPC